MAFDRPSYRTRPPEKDRTFPRAGKTEKNFSNPWKTNHFRPENFSKGCHSLWSLPHIRAASLPVVEWENPPKKL